MSVPTLLLGAALALGQVAGSGRPVDPHIQLVTYDPGQVVTLSVADGYAAVVELGAEERVDSVVVGNSAVWQVTASKRGDHIIVKPLSGAQPTDMIVVTGDRRYVFLLQPAGAGGPAPFVVRFVYPDAAPVALSATSVPIATYRYRGAKALFPIAMSDDGQRTTISWGRDTALPAIFAVEKGGQEAIVNGRMVGGDYVVERTAERFVFRSGTARAIATRRLARAGR